MALDSANKPKILVSQFVDPDNHQLGTLMDSAEVCDVIYFKDNQQQLVEEDLQIDQGPWDTVKFHATIILTESQMKDKNTTFRLAFTKDTVAEGVS